MSPTSGSPHLKVTSPASALQRPRYQRSCHHILGHSIYSVTGTSLLKCDGDSEKTRLLSVSFHCSDHSDTDKCFRTGRELSYLREKKPKSSSLPRHLEILHPKLNHKPLGKHNRRTEHPSYHPVITTTAVNLYQCYNASKYHCVHLLLTTAWCQDQCQVTFTSMAAHGKKASRHPFYRHQTENKSEMPAHKDSLQREEVQQALPMYREESFRLTWSSM